MARIKDEKSFDEKRTRLLKLGVELIRVHSFQGIGINDILKLTGIPKGSFYHYFENKEAFGLEVAQYYHDEQIQSAKAILTDKNYSSASRIYQFFNSAAEQFQQREFKHGCLMCNLTTEIADENINFQMLLNQHWQELSAELAKCIENLGTKGFGLAHLSSTECADWLINSWSGSLTRMKASGDNKPLELFLKTIFINKS